MVPNWNGLNWRVISNRQPPMKLAPVSEAPGSPPRNGGAPKPRRPRQAPLCLGGIPSQSPSEGGCRGTECCPFFCSICRPQSGRVGNETMPFFSASGMTQIRNICVTSENALKLIKIGPCSASVGCDEAGTTLKSSELVAREQPKTGHVQTSLKPGKSRNKPQRTLKSSEFVAREHPM